MLPVTDLRKGITFQIEGVPYKVVEYSHVKMGRGNATIRVTVRNLKTGSVEEKTYNSGASFDPITTIKRKLQYLYQDAENAIFMDPKNYDQVEIDKTILGNDLKYLREGQDIDVNFWADGARGDQPLGVELPPNLVLKVIEADPGVKGNSATNIYKSVKLENGLTIKAPLFIKVGDKLRVDTRTGGYVERAK